MSEAKIVRSAEEVRRAHDLLVGFLFDEGAQAVVLANDPEREHSLDCMKTSADVLCWALGHPNHNFEENLLKLEVAMLGAGFVEVDDGPGGDGNGPLPS